MKWQHNTMKTITIHKLNDNCNLQLEATELPSREAVAHFGGLRSINVKEIMQMDTSAMNNLSQYDLRIISGNAFEFVPEGLGYTPHWSAESYMDKEDALYRANLRVGATVRLWREQYIGIA